MVLIVVVSILVVAHYKKGIEGEIDEGVREEMEDKREGGTR